MTGSSHSGTGDVSPEHLVAILKHLGATRGPVGVIRVAEAWARQRPLPLAARTVEAQSFVDLLLLDRAWVRLREVLSESPEDVQANTVLADVFIRRGWGERAAEPLALLRRIAPETPMLASLEAAHGELLEAGTGSGLGAAGDPLAGAERLLAEGSVLQAREALQALRVSKQGDQQRVAELLWGIRAEYDEATETAEEILSELDFDPTDIDWREETGKLSAEATGQPLETQEVGRPNRVGPGVRFPSLFRGDDSVEHTASRDEEVTVASIMADVDALDEPPTSESGAVDDAESTAVLDIIQTGMTAERENTPAIDPLRRPLDLRSLESDAEDSWTGAIEDDLVVMKPRQQAPAAHTDPAIRRRGPIGVIEKVPVPPPIPDNLPGEDEDTPALGLPTVVVEPTESVVPLVHDASGRRRFVAPLAVLLAAFAAVGAGLHYMRVAATQTLVNEVHDAVLSGDAQLLASLAQTLRQQVADDGSSVGVLAAELALVESILYREFSGEVEGISRARSAMSKAQSARTTPPEELALATGALRWAEGDLEGVLTAVSHIQASSEVGLRLAVAAALELEDSQRALSLWRAPDDPSRVPWLAVLSPGIAALDGGGAAAARQAAQLEGLGPAALVPLLVEGWTDAAPGPRLKAVEAMLGRAAGLERQQVALLESSRTQLKLELGRDGLVRDAESTVERAPASAEGWEALGTVHLHNHRIKASLAAFDRCLQIRPKERRCVQGKVQALLGLDRLVEASALAIDGEWGQWVAAESGELSDLSVVGLVSAYAVGRSAIESTDPTVRLAAKNALRDQLEGVSGRGDAQDVVWAGRVEAVSLRLLGEEADRRHVETLQRRTPSDPVVMVHLAAFHEERGKPDVAAALLASAADSAPDYALVHYAQGLLHYSPKTMDDARVAWRRYLQLAPSGRRADRVRERIGG